MLQTVEVLIDVNGEIHWSEPLTITKPTRALVTVLENNGAPVAEAGNAGALLEFLRTHRLPPESKPSAEEIEAQIEEARNSWE